MYHVFCIFTGQHLYIYDTKILYALSTDTSIHFWIENIPLVSPLQYIYYNLMFDTWRKLTWSTDTSVQTQIDWMIVVSVLNDILITP